MQRKKRASAFFLRCLKVGQNFTIFFCTIEAWNLTGLTGRRTGGVKTNGNYKRFFEL